MLKTSDKVSDLILSPGRPPRVELGGNLHPVAFPGRRRMFAFHPAPLVRIASISDFPSESPFSTYSRIEQMVRDGVLTQEGALPYASNANNLLLRLGDPSGKAAVPTTPSASTADESMLNMIER